MSPSALPSNYKGALVNGDGDFLCKCGSRMRISTVMLIWKAQILGRSVSQHPI
ncbi:hypothetical protein BDV30DRAFT_207265, partial [Aspergillus minisclerotigenes]